MDSYPLPKIEQLKKIAKRSLWGKSLIEKVTLFSKGTVVLIVVDTAVGVDTIVEVVYRNWRCFVESRPQKLPQK